MKTIVSAICIFLVVGCGAIRPDITDEQKACAAVCGALDAARCWDEPDFYSVVKVGADLGTCIADCINNGEVAARINTQCLVESNGCDLLKCVQR